MGWHRPCVSQGHDGERDRLEPFPRTMDSRGKLSLWSNLAILLTNLESIQKKEFWSKLTRSFLVDKTIYVKREKYRTSVKWSSLQVWAMQYLHYNEGRTK